MHDVFLHCVCAAVCCSCCKIYSQEVVAGYLGVNAFQPNILVESCDAGQLIIVDPQHLQVDLHLLPL